MLLSLLVATSLVGCSSSVSQNNTITSGNDQIGLTPPPLKIQEEYKKETES
jgi:hypothetical protein